MRLDFGSILATGMHSDFIVECKGYSFKAHKAILRTASPFFKAVIEGNTKENEESKLHMPDDHPEILARLLVYIYTGQYVKSVLQWKCDGITPFATVPGIAFNFDRSDKSRSMSRTWQASCVVAIAMYQVADKTLIDELKWASRGNLLSSMRPDRDDESRDREFWAEDEMHDVVSIITSVYECTRPDDWMLHDLVVHRMLIGISQGCLRWEPYQKLLEDVPRLAVEIATSQLSTPRMQRKCKVCHQKTRQRLWRCKCGGMYSCHDEECIKLRMTRFICDTCAVFGTCY